MNPSTYLSAKKPHNKDYDQKKFKNKHDKDVMKFTIPSETVLRDRLKALPHHFDEARAELRRQIERQMGWR